jgi:hypothetical protein
MRRRASAARAKNRRASRPMRNTRIANRTNTSHGSALITLAKCRRKRSKKISPVWSRSPRFSNTNLPTANNRHETRATSATAPTNNLCHRGRPFPTFQPSGEKYGLQ